MYPNSLPLLGISTPKCFSSIIQFSQIHINLSVLIRKGDCDMFLTSVSPFGCDRGYTTTHRY